MLRLSQAKIWNSWSFEINDAFGNLLGEIRAPTWAQATNSRLPVVARADAVAANMSLPSGNFAIRFEHLRRGWNNDVAWWLESPEGVVLARIEKIFPEAAGALPRHFVRIPHDGELTVVSARKLQPFDARLCLSDGQEVLRITSPGWLRLKLSLTVEGNFGLVPQRAFLAYYALHHR